MVRQPLTTEYALLGFLRRRPMYGYEIHQQLADPTGLGLVWRLKQSRLYALLGKLEEHGLVTTTLEPQESRPPRKVFELTDQGRDAFLSWVEQPVEHGRRLRLDFLAKLYFAQQEGAAITQKLIEQQRQTCLSWLAEQQDQAEALAETQPYDWLVHQFRVSQIQAMLDWLDTCQKTLLPLVSLPDSG
ncbi:MAG: PadR family transcriptional regulator [Chloroflexota bacterium]